ncbi:disease resistance protein RPV1-like isoform X1 [Macadamia integrifolia]|uniref:disease resistance protein RPV1-like isoform X1 n=1 Tax=Macadamia integrifolia TaxID=60698 RepID=UPI001C4F655D|nr:disease resistance protein RPV1-like isoform X1 [Macadamia integrifolia]
MATHTVISSFSSSRSNYDVFLSFEGEETEKIFASNLYAFLERAEIKTFKDDEHMNRRGEHLSETVKKGIKESRIAIVIFSRNYASKISCLEELELIMECKENLGQKVFPVFLMGVDGSTVRDQKGSFEEPFRLYQECFEGEMVERWRSALRKAGGIRGWNLIDVPVPDGDEEKLIEMMVEQVLSALGQRPVEHHHHAKKTTKKTTKKPLSW